MDGIIDNLQNAIQTWNEKLAEIWSLLTNLLKTSKAVDLANHCKNP